MGSHIFGKSGVRVALSLLCALLWGIGFPLIKLGYVHVGIESTNPFGTILFAGIRFFFAGLITIPISKPWRRGAINKTPSGVALILALALVQTVMQYVFQYVGICNTTGSTSSIIGQSNVFLLCFISPLFFKDDRLTIKKIIGCAIGFAGIVIVNIKDGMQFAFSPDGELLVLFASIAASAGFIMGKKISKNQNAAAVSSIQQTVGGVILIAVGLIGGGRFTKFDIQALPIILILILSAAVANTLWSVLLKYNPVSCVSVYKFATPMFGMIFSALLLGEDIFKWSKIVSLLAVGVGIFIVNFSRKRKSKND